MTPLILILFIIVVLWGEYEEEKQKRDCRKAIQILEEGLKKIEILDV